MTQPLSDASRIFGERVRAQRLKVSCSQEEIALLAGMNVSNYGKIERGLGNPNFDTIVRIASALDTDPGKLVERITSAALPEHERAFSAAEFIKEKRARQASR